MNKICSRALARSEGRTLQEKLVTLWTMLHGKVKVKANFSLCLIKHDNMKTYEGMEV
jgi:hypothetical protein